MPAAIEVTPRADDEFEVRVRDERSESLHQVTVSAKSLESLGGGDPSELLEAAFRFLLDREPKESILSRFDVTVISRYFPEFLREISKYRRR